MLMRCVAGACIDACMHAGTVLDRDLAGDYRPGWLRRPAARAVLPFLQDVWLRKVRLQALPREQEVAFSGTGARV